MSRIKYLITGGCGFIGTSFLADLLKREPEANVRILDNMKTGTHADLKSVTNYEVIAADDVQKKSGVVLIEGDIRDAEITSMVAEGVDCIIHLAANTGVGPSVEDPRFDMECNVIGTFNMLEAARKHSVKRFVFASSGAPAGEVTPPIHEELPPHPVSPYGSSKLAGEGYCSAYARTFGVETVCLRFGNVYGPRSGKKSSVVAKFIRQAMAGETCTIFGTGKQTRDFIYIDDLVGAMVKSVETEGIGGETFQIATGAENTVEEVAGVIKSVLNENGIAMTLENSAPRLGDVMRNYSDTTKALKMLGWKPEMDLKEGIKITVDYFKKIK